MQNIRSHQFAKTVAVMQIIDQHTLSLSLSSQKRILLMLPDAAFSLPVAAHGHSSEQGVCNFPMICCFWLSAPLLSNIRMYHQGRFYVCPVCIPVKFPKGKCTLWSAECLEWCWANWGCLIQTNWMPDWTADGGALIWLLSGLFNYNSHPLGFRSHFTTTVFWSWCEECAGIALDYDLH